MDRLALFLLVPLLGGCNVHSNGGGNENVSINADGSGNIAFDLPFMKGGVKVPAAMMHNSDVDIDGVKLMPGSKVTGLSVDAHDRGATVDISFTAPQSADQVRSYFLDQFRKHRVEAAMSGNAITGRSKDGNPFSIDVGPAASGSQGKIVLQSKD